MISLIVMGGGLNQNAPDHGSRLCSGVNTRGGGLPFPPPFFKDPLQSNWRFLEQAWDEASFHETPSMRYLIMVTVFHVQISWLGHILSLSGVDSEIGLVCIVGCRSGWSDCVTVTVTDLDLKYFLFLCRLAELRCHRDSARGSLKLMFPVTGKLHLIQWNLNVKQSRWWRILLVWPFISPGSLIWEIYIWNFTYFHVSVLNIKYIHLKKEILEFTSLKNVPVCTQA